MLTKLRKTLLLVVPDVIYASYDYDNEQNTVPPFIVYQETSKRPKLFAEDAPVYYEVTVQINLITKKKNLELEGRLETTLLSQGYTFSVLSEYKNEDGSLNRAYEIRLEEFKYGQ